MNSSIGKYLATIILGVATNAQASERPYISLGGGLNSVFVGQTILTKMEPSAIASLTFPNGRIHHRLTVVATKVIGDTNKTVVSLIKPSFNILFSPTNGKVFFHPYLIAGFGYEKVTISKDLFRSDLFAQYGVGMNLGTSKDTVGWFTEFKQLIIRDHVNKDLPSRTESIITVGLKLSLGTKRKTKLIAADPEVDINAEYYAPVILKYRPPKADSIDYDTVEKNDYNPVIKK